MRIVVGTTSALKVRAVQEALEEATVIGVKTNSGVPEQPLGEETELGAQNRLAEARLHEPDADVYIGIENGIFNESGHYIDKAVVVIENKEGVQQIEYSKGVIFPEIYFLQAQERGFDKITVGQVMFEAGVVSTKDDPHADLGDKVSRVVFLTETIKTAFEHLTARTHLSCS